MLGDMVVAVSLECFHSIRNCLFFRDCENNSEMVEHRSYERNYTKHLHSSIH